METNLQRGRIIVVLCTTIKENIMTSSFSIEPLVDLGLTAMEAEVYGFLVENSPATGYKIAKAIGKPTANTYKAIQSLQARGIVLVEDSKKRLCRAVPIDEFLNGLEKKFRQTKNDATKELTKLKPAPDDERLYYLQTPDQMYERFRQMLEKCQEIALLDLFPEAVTQLREEIENTVSRGIHVAVKVYIPCKIKGVEIITDPVGEKTINRWPGMWANGVIDGFEHLMALLSKDGTRVIQAVWSANTYISWVYHSAFMHELLHDTLHAFSFDKESTEIPDQYSRLQSFLGEDARGYHTLIERLDNKK